MKNREIIKLLQTFWKKAALVLALNLCVAAAGLLNPYLTKLVIDKAYVGRDLKLFLILFGIGAAVFVFSSLLGSVSGYLNRKMRLELGLEMAKKVVNKLYSLPYAYFQDSSSGKELYRINYDVEQVSSMFCNVLLQAIIALPKAILVFGIIFYLNRQIALFALLFLPLSFGATYLFNRKIKAALKEWIDCSQDVFRKLQEALAHIYLVKAFGKGRQQAEAYASSMGKSVSFNLKAGLLEAKSRFANSLLNRMILGVLVLYAGYQVIEGRMTLGAISAIALYLGQLSAAQATLTAFWQQLIQGRISVERLDSVLNVSLGTQEQETENSKTVFPSGQIEFKDVSFSYAAEKQVLKNLNISLPASGLIGLVGPSGCGKTTIANLILRLYRPDTGGIFIDGINIREIKPGVFYDQTGVVLQEPYLWNDTIEENIRFGLPGATSQGVEEAARSACIDCFINSLPRGYETIIGENACKISEGQKQRIAIARALIKKPKILILDEAFSCVEPEIESKIINNLKIFTRGNLVIIISHRISSIENTERVYFLGNPSKIDIASHLDLLKNNPQYQSYLARSNSS